MREETEKNYFKKEHKKNTLPLESSKVFHSLRDIVVERGEFSGIIKLDVFVNTHLVCTISGDGVVFATPSGSMTYSMALGGSIIHTDIPCVCMTPINPYSLSSRPLILPDYSVITVKMNPGCRADPIIQIDGYDSARLTKDDVLVIQMSTLDVPSKSHTSLALNKSQEAVAYVGFLVITSIEKKTFKSWVEKLKKLLGYYR